MIHHSKRAGVAAVLTWLACLANPVSADELAVKRGAALFATHCLGCHAAGPGNVGTTMLANRLGPQRSVLADRGDLDPIFTATMVRYGIGVMPGFRPSEITDEELVDLAAYLGRNR